MKKRHKEVTLHLFFVASLVVLVGIVSFFRWPSDVTGAGVRSVCVVPESGMDITQDTTLCTGTYTLDQPLHLRGSNLLLDCNQAVLSGKGGTGIIVEGQGMIIKDCMITSFDQGVILESAALVAFEGVTYEGNGQNVVQQ